MSDGLVGSKRAKTFVNYVKGFRRCRYIAVEMARKNLEGSQSIQKSQYDHQAEYRQFGLGAQAV